MRISDWSSDVCSSDLGYLTGVPTVGIPRDADWSATAAPLDARARAYLDINCAHCHSPTGPARVSGLWLDSANADPRALGVCTPPVAAGSSEEGRVGKEGVSTCRSRWAPYH